MEGDDQILSNTVQLYSWDDEMTKHAQEIIGADEKPLTEEQVTKLENYQRLHWDVFYKNNTTNFYKDRHYIHAEFIELRESL